MTTEIEIPPDAPALLKTPTHLIAVRVTFSGRERFHVRGMREITPSHDRGADYYTLKVIKSEAAGRLPVGARGRLVIEAEDARLGKSVPPAVFDDPRTWRVVSNLFGGHCNDIGYYLITFAASPEGC